MRKSAPAAAHHQPPHTHEPAFPTAHASHLQLEGAGAAHMKATLVNQVRSLVNRLLQPCLVVHFAAEERRVSMLLPPARPAEATCPHLFLLLPPFWAATLPTKDVQGALGGSRFQPMSSPVPAAAATRRAARAATL